MKHDDDGIISLAELLRIRDQARVDRALAKKFRELARFFSARANGKEIGKAPTLPTPKRRR